MSLWGRTVITS
jgi:ubiquinol-cytochrome c reductase cytochrome b subunit